jgi:hypothetical protein
MTEGVYLPGDEGAVGGEGGGQLKETLSGVGGYVKGV